ncbi:ion transporter [Streptomyces fumanus]|nr:ion transporter [Streptomyces fumanus]
MTQETTAGARRRLAERCRAVTEARGFAVAVFALILGNALLLGVETYSGAVERWHGGLKLVEHGFLAAFTAEILLRLGAHADRPKEFVRDPWNVFDVLVVLCAFVPVVRENATVLRLLRLARVLRAARFLPQLRVVMVAMARSLPGTVSFLLVGALLLYVYAMVGWVFFAPDDPEHYGSLGRAVLTLFLLMTLDGLGDAVRTGLEISRWSILYHASYVLLASFVLVNVLIGVVLNSLDEARDMERDADERTPPAPPATTPVPGDPHRLVRERIARARRALDELEESLGPLAPPRAAREDPSERRTPPCRGARPVPARHPFGPPGAGGAAGGGAPGAH